MSLYDAIKKNLKPAEQSPQPSRYEEVERLMQAKTGKAVSGTSAAPKASRKGEERATQMANTQMQQIGQQGQMQGMAIDQQQSAQQQQFEQQRQQLGQQRQLAIQEMDTNEQIKLNEMANKADNALKQMSAQKGIQTDQLFTDLNMKIDQLGLDQAQADFEQRSFMAALSDKNYLAELERSGKQMQLENNMNFEEEAFNIAAGEEMKLLLDQLGFDLDILGDELKLSEKLGELDINSLTAIADMAQDAASKTAMVQGGTELVSAGIKNYDKFNFNFGGGESLPQGQTRFTQGDFGEQVETDDFTEYLKKGQTQKY